MKATLILKNTRFFNRSRLFQAHESNRPHSFPCGLKYANISNSRAKMFPLNQPTIRCTLLGTLLDTHSLKA